MIFANTWAVAPWANSELLIAVVVALGGIGASAGFWETMRSRRKKKISAEEHEKAALEKAKENDASESAELVASALTIVNQWQSMVTDLTERHEKEMDRRDRRHEAELKKVNARLDAEISRSDRLEQRVGQLGEESQRQSRTIFYLRAAVSRIQEWWQRIEAEWEEVRQHPHPPKFPHIDIKEEV